MDKKGAPCDILYRVGMRKAWVSSTECTGTYPPVSRGLRTTSTADALWDNAFFSSEMRWRFEY